MSSRSFRRRNNRRRHRPAAGGDPTGQKPGVPERSPEQGPLDRRREGGQRRDRPQGRGGRGPGARGGRAAEPLPPRPEVPLVFPDCPICGKPVRELSSALTHRVSRQPAHFDCVVREVRDANPVAPQEKLCYLGGGSFGILEFRSPGATSGFVIKKRIQYEEKEFPQLWKKPLQISC
jgi:hypothetical protein